MYFLPREKKERKKKTKIVSCNLIIKFFFPHGSKKKKKSSKFKITKMSSNEEYDADNFVYVDADGEPIPPEAEASCLMAAEFGDGTENAEFESTEWFSAELLRASEFFRAKVGDDATELCRGEGGDSVHHPDSSPEDFDEVVKNDAKDAVEEPLFSREYSDHVEEEEWLLESLLRRRVHHATKQHEYLCKWKWYAQQTWEPRLLLEEEGHEKMLDSFDVLHSSLTPRTSKLRPVFYVKRLANVGDDPMTCLEQYFGNIMGKIQEFFYKAGFVVERVSTIVNEVRAQKFMVRWGDVKDSQVPLMLSHGTRKVNIPSIIQHGLVVPGTLGVKVLNGSAHGVGIYTARTPFVSQSYTDCGAMFVCVGLVGAQSQRIHMSNDIIVFFGADDVLPVWLVRYSPRSGTANDAPQRVPYTYFWNSAAPVGAVPFAPINVQVQILNSRRPFDRFGDLTKKLIRQAPREVKSLYRAGLLKSKK